MVMKKIVIIGAGMGGLATGLRSRYLGFEVTVLEKQVRPGGCSNVIEEAGFRVDIGPTILVMKSAFEEAYQSFGQDIHKRIDFAQLDPNYRIYYHDGDTLDLYSNMAKLAHEVEKIETDSAKHPSQSL
jgi:phytoene dehydrogenase-like protein